MQGRIQTALKFKRRCAVLLPGYTVFSSFSLALARSSSSLTHLSVFFCTSSCTTGPPPRTVMARMAWPQLASAQCPFACLLPASAGADEKATGCRVAWREGGRGKAAGVRGGEGPGTVKPATTCFHPRR